MIIQLATESHRIELLCACSANKLQLPCQQAGMLVMQRILSACSLVVQMLPAVHAGAAQLLAQLGMTYFMPFCLSALAMLARIQVTSSFLSLSPEACRTVHC